MVKGSLNKTKPYLADPAKRQAIFRMTDCTSRYVEDALSGLFLTSCLPVLSHPLAAEDEDFLSGAD